MKTNVIKNEKLLDQYNLQLALQPKRIKQIKHDVAAPRFTERMIESFFPRHVGDENLKMQLLCMSVAMPLHLNSEEARRQAECEALNMIVVGEPGTGKTSLAIRVLDLVPHGDRAMGAGATKAGLTMAADTRLGAIPSANMGIFILAELDKMKHERSARAQRSDREPHRDVTKSGGNTTLSSNICFIGLANPRVKTWELTKQSIEHELNINYALLTRCVINIQKDNANEDIDDRIARGVLNKDQEVLQAFDDGYIQDYILLARGTIHPLLREEDKKRMRNATCNPENAARRIPSPRFVEQMRSFTSYMPKFLRAYREKEDVIA
jgi:DNA replicative helicase MCM subunit Mcm2 (Cdc46/Mcm family)